MLTVFPRIVSSKTIQWRKLFKGGNYLRLYSIGYLQILHQLNEHIKFLKLTVVIEILNYLVCQNEDYNSKSQSGKIEPLGIITQETITWKL